MANIKRSKKTYLVVWTGNNPESIDSHPWTTIIEAKNFVEAYEVGWRFATRECKTNKIIAERLTSFSVSELRSDTLAQYRADSKILSKLVKAGVVTESMISEASKKIK